MNSANDQFSPTRAASRRQFSISCLSVLLISLLSLGIIGLGAQPCSAAEEILTNASVIQLQSLNLGDDIVIEKIKTSKCNFDTSADALQQLKEAKVSAAVILAMIKTQAPATSHTAPTASTSVSAASPSDSVKIQVKTPVRLIVDETLSSGISKSGQTFRLKVAENVVVNGNVVIAKGAPATGRITAVKKKIFATSNGKLEFVVDSVQAIDGQNITLEGHISEDGGEASYGQIGKDVKFEKGHLVTAVVESDKEVNLNKVSVTVVPMMTATDATNTMSTTNIISDPVVEKLCESLAQDNPGKVKDALNKLRDKKLKDNASQAIPKILPCLANSKPDVVREALKTLAAIGNQDAVPALLPLLTNDRPDIVREACRTLAAIGNKDTISSLEPLLSNPRPDIRDEAYKAIAKLRAKS